MQNLLFPALAKLRPGERYAMRFPVSASRRDLLAVGRPKRPRTGCRKSFPQTSPECFPVEAFFPRTSRKAGVVPKRKALPMPDLLFPALAKLRPRVLTEQTLPAIHLPRRYCQTHRKGSAACPRPFPPEWIQPFFLPVFQKPVLPFPQLQKCRKGLSKYRRRQFPPSGIRLFLHWTEKNRQSPCLGYSPNRETKPRSHFHRLPGGVSLATRTDPRLFLLPLYPLRLQPELPALAVPAKIPRRELALVRLLANLPTRAFPRGFRFSGHTPLSKRRPADLDRATGDNTGCDFRCHLFRHRHRLGDVSRTDNRDSCTAQIHRLRLRRPNLLFPRESSTGQDFPLRTVARKVPPGHTKAQHPGLRSDAAGRQARHRPWSLSFCQSPCEEILPLSPYSPLGFRFQVQSLRRREEQGFRFVPDRPCFRPSTPRPLPRLRTRCFRQPSELSPVRFFHLTQRAFPQKLPKALHAYRECTESTAFQNS